MGLINRIKKDAVGTGAKIQDHESRQLEQILNELFYLQKDIEEETKFVKHVMTRGFETQERSGLHASALLESDKKFCVRAQVLSLHYKQIQNDMHNVGLLRIFEEGNAIHEKWQRLFIRGGYAKALDCDYTNFHPKYNISFTPDIIATIPQFYEKPMVVEIKSMNTYAYRKQTKHKSGTNQLHWYMFLNGLDKGFVLAEDKNNQEFRVELHDYDKSVVAPFIDRAEEVRYRNNILLTKKKMIKRPKVATSPDSDMCKGCAMKDACWNIGMGRVKLDVK